KAAGIPCTGIEPTRSTAQAARARGIEIVEEFFGIALGEKLAREGKAADLTVANNVLAHVPDINDFVGGFAKLLKPQGVATFEFPHLLNMVALNQFDTAYHEHYSYLSLTAVHRIFAANGLSLFDVEEIPTHGGSLRVFARRTDTGKHAITPAVAAMLAREEAAGMKRLEYYTPFQKQAERVKDDIVAFLIEAKKKGLRVGAYGAAAKGNTLMNFAGIRPDLVPYVVDRAAAKQGRFMPGSRIPIVEEAHLWADKPDLVLILPWNIRVEVMEQLSGIRAWGGKFIVAVPKLEVT
ncbi:MAG: methyltransferase domain-containing protein, partial [Methylobacterium sp.]|nr:methyltransferase domain-containing protein [Methylobacterium sp.]